jgi:hypothetical protein
MACPAFFYMGWADTAFAAAGVRYWQQQCIASPANEEADARALRLPWNVTLAHRLRRLGRSVAGPERPPAPRRTNGHRPAMH